MQDMEDDLYTKGIPLNSWSAAHPCCDLEYADDTLLMGRTKAQITHILHSLETAARRYGLYLNYNKTQLLTMYDEDGPAVTFLDGSLVSTCHTAKYLGALVEDQGNPLHNVKYRLAQATNDYKKMQYVWNSGILLKEKMHVFNTIFIPKVLYSLCHTALTRQVIRKIDGWYISHLRKLLKFKHSYYSRISHGTVWERAGRPPLLSHRLYTHQLKYYGHVLRASQEDPIFHCCLTTSYFPHTMAHKSGPLARARGRPKPTWITELNTKLSSHTAIAQQIPGFPCAAKHQTIEIAKVAKQREKWQRILEVPMRPQTFPWTLYTRRSAAA